MQTMLFLTPELPYPARSGGKLKSLKLLERFQQEYQVSLACLLKADDRSNVIRFLSEFSLFQRVLMEPVDVPRTPANLLRSYLKGVPLNVLRTYSETFESEVEKIIHEFDVVFVDHYEVAQYVPRDYTGQVIYHAHNAYHKIWESYSTTGANPFTRVVSHWESQRVLQAELDVCRRAQLTFASPNDIEALVACGADPVRMEETFHLGDESQLEQPPMVFEETTERLVFVGHLAWEPNVTGLLWFLSEVWPRLLLQHPCLHLDIVGANPDRRLQRAAERDRRVHLLGYVEDLEDVYPRSRVNIAPLQFGAGMKVKVLNAMARGIPVVTTPVGAEGIEVENGQHLLISDDAEQMAQDILQLLVDPPLWQRLSNKSRELVTERYTWDKLYTRMLLAMDPARRLRLIRSRMTAGVRNLRERRLGAA